MGIYHKIDFFSAGFVIAPQNNDHILYFQEAGKEQLSSVFLVSLMWQRDAKQFPVTARIALFLYTTLDSVVQFCGETCLLTQCGSDKFFIMCSMGQNKKFISNSTLLKTPHDIRMRCKQSEKQYLNRNIKKSEKTTLFILF